MSKDAKALRGAVRQLVPEVLTDEAVKAIVAELNKRNAESWRQIENMVRFKLDALDKRSKEIESYVMRTIADATKPKE
jgi:uncharacterized coiled-coil protein SlyX